MPKNTFPGTLTEANLAQLADEDVSKFDPGTLAYVQDLDAYYRYDPTDTTPPDGISVIKPNNVSLGGRWSLLISEGDEFANQPLWFIDPVNGNDENNGNSALTPLKTHEELRRRIGNSIISILVTVTLMGNFPKDNPVRIDFTLGFGGRLIYLGSQGTIITNGRCTAIQQVNCVTNTPWAMTTTFDWTVADAINHANGSVSVTGAGRRIRFLPGSSIPGACCWAVKDLGANKAMISPPADFFTFQPFYNFILPVAGGPGVGDEFVVEELFQVENFAVDLKCDGQVGFVSGFDPIPPTLTILNLSLGDLTDSDFGFATSSTNPVRSNAQGAFAGALAPTAFVNCQVAATAAYDASLLCFASHIAGQFFEWVVKNGASPLYFHACAQTTRVAVGGGEVSYGSDCVAIYDAAMAPSSGLEVTHGGTAIFGGGSLQPGGGAVGFWDYVAGLGAIFFTGSNSAGSAEHEAYSGDGGVVYGIQATGPGINIRPGCQFTYLNGFQPTIQGGVPGVDDIRVDNIDQPITLDTNSVSGAIYTLSRDASEHNSRAKSAIGIGATVDLFQFLMEESTATLFTARAVVNAGTLCGAFETEFTAQRIVAANPVIVGAPVPIIVNSNLNGGGALTISVSGAFVVVSVTGDTVLASECKASLERLEMGAP